MENIFIESSVIITALGAAVSYGILKAKVDTLDRNLGSMSANAMPNAERLARLETQYQEILRILVELRETLRDRVKNL